MKTKRYTTPLLVLMALMLSAAALAAPTGVKRGDVNGDGKLSVADVTALITIVNGGDNVEPYKFKHEAADVNKDKTIDKADVITLVKILMLAKIDVNGNFVVGDTDEESVHDEEVVNGEDAWVKRREIGD